MIKLVVIFFTIISFLSYTPGVPDHSGWNSLLSSHVSENGKVNYVGFQNDKEKLNDYIINLSKNPPTSSWSREESMAYWINAYNAHTVSLILKNYPLSSIMDINNGKAWDLMFIKIGNNNYSLNNIEHDILRFKYPDPRIHFAVNCAAKSCPKLNNQAFTAQNLESNLNQLAKEFINNSDKNDLSSNPIKISKLFDWYKKDFTKKGSVIDYINKYADSKIAPSTKLGYKEYDWGLNY